MNHLDLTNSGNVLGTNFRPKLERLREEVAVIKDIKLVSRHRKLMAINRLDVEFNCGEVLEHLVSEVVELRAELVNASDCDVVLKEVADVINCAEIIGALVMDKNRVVSNGSG